MAPSYIIPSKEMCIKKEKNSPNIYFEVLMKEKMAPSADAHKKFSKEMCDTN